MAELAEKAAEAWLQRIAAIEVELQNINARQMTCGNETTAESAVKEAKAGLEKLESGKITMAIEMAKAEVMLENSEKELEKGLERI